MPWHLRPGLIGGSSGGGAVGGGGGSLAPSGLTGLIAWYDASIFGSFSFSSGSNISTWADQSGAGNTMNWDRAHPVYNATGFNTSHPAVIIDPASVAGTLDVTSFAMGTGNTLTVFYVGKFDGDTAGTTNPRPVAYAKPASNDFDNTGSWCIALDGISTNGISFNRNSTVADAVLTTTVNQRVIVTVDSSGNVTLYWNGVSSGTANIPGNWVSGGTLCIGRSGQRSNSIGYWNGPLSEVGVATGFTNSTNVALLDTYLKNKWGL